jgi:hypothetical protein
MIGLVLTAFEPPAAAQPVSWFSIAGDNLSKKMFVRESETISRTHAAAPKALLFVFDLIAENVFVMTAINRLMSQKFNTITQMMKKRQEMKYSASIAPYIMGDHC